MGAAKGRERFRVRGNTEEFIANHRTRGTGNEDAKARARAPPTRMGSFLGSNPPPAQPAPHSPSAVDSHVVWHQPVHYSCWDQQHPRSHHRHHRQLQEQQMHAAHLKEKLRLRQLQEKYLQRVRQQRLLELQRARAKRAEMIKESDERLQKIQRAGYIFKENGERDYEQEMVAFIMGL